MVMTEKKLPAVLVLNTGGTITGYAADEASTSVYEAGAVTLSTLLSSVPTLIKYAELRAETLAQINSKDIQFALWLQLAERITAAQQEQDISGIVIVHGTDTLEETAYFLQLSVTLVKPLVLVGAMRPITALSSDGPLNLLCAVRLASHSGARDCGPLVLINQQFFAAREATKISAHAVDAFSAPGQSPMGRIFDDEIRWLRRPLPMLASLTLDTTNNNDDPWPWVEILNNFAGADGRAVHALVKAGVNGLVIAGTGAGTLSESLSAALQQARLAGVAVVRASRCLLGPVLCGVGADDQALGTFPAGDLSPQKARVLLLVGLRKRLNQAELTHLFEREARMTCENSAH